MTRPIIEHTTSQYDPKTAHKYSPTCRCIRCFEERTDRLAYPARPVLRIPLRTWLLAVTVSVALVAGGVLAAKAIAKPAERATPRLSTSGTQRGVAIAAAEANGGDKPHPIKAPAALAKARAACPVAATRTCYLAALRHAYTSLSWQKDAREHTQALTVQAITRDAIQWAADRYGVSAAAMTTVGLCESHLWPFATNGIYKGWAQLGAHHLADPIFDAVPWRDAYAEASHMARYVKAHGYGEWQCSPAGGLRW